MKCVMYAVREIGTDKYLPYMYPAYGRTQREPEAGVVPALFINPAAARKAINMWAEGIRKRKMIRILGDDGFWTFGYQPVPERNKESLEIVEATITIDK